MQEPVSKDLLSKTNELGQYKEVVQEKDVLIKNNKAKMKELEKEIIELKLKNEALEVKMKVGSLDENGFQIFRMQEPVSKDLLSKTNELGQYKEVVQEKDVLIKNNKAKMKELEKEITELKLKNEALEVKMKVGSLDENGFQAVMINYDDFLKKVWTERQELLDKNNVLETYMENLETSYNDLLEKFGKAKIVIQGLKENQDILKNELGEYRTVIEILEKKYESLKVHSESKIAEANEEIDNKEKGNIQEVAKLKAKILQSQAKINELEKHVKFEDIRPRQSMFAPLKNNLSKA